MIDPSNLDTASLPSVALEDKGALPNVSAVYLAIDSLGQVQYVGRSQSLKTRWYNHHRQQDLEPMQGVRIAYLSCDSALLDEVEAALIKWFCPPLNGPRSFCRTPKRVINISKFWPCHKWGKEKSVGSVVTDLMKTPLQMTRYTLEKAKAGALTGADIDTIDKLILLCSQWSGNAVTYDDITTKKNDD